MSSGNFLESLLDGVAVEWKALGEVAEYSPARVDATNLDATSFVGVDNLVTDKGGRIDASYLPNTVRLTAYEPGDILLGNIRPYLKKIWKATNSGGCSGDVLAIRIQDNFKPIVAPTFLYYLLSSDEFFSYNMQHAKGAKMPRGDKAAILGYPIPIPCPENPKKSLEIQTEIARILDALTAQTAELTGELAAELSARKKQYAYYRDQLLSFEDGEVEWRTLGEVAIIGTGSRNSNEAVLEGKYPFFVRSQEPRTIDEYEFDETAVITAGDGVGVGKVFHFVSGKYALHQRAYRIVATNSYVLPKFLFYFIRNDFSRYLATISVHASVTSLRKPMFEKYTVPIPPLAEQTRTVAILDKFEDLTNSISEGLPREIELRQKQYEYYRAMLFSFPKPQEVA